MEVTTQHLDKTYGMEYERVAFWDIFDYTIGAWMASHVEKKTFALLDDIFDKKERQKFSNPEQRARMLKKIRRNFGETKFSPIYNQTFWFLNKYSLLMRHFSKYVANGVALDDVYNGRGDFRLFGQTIYPDSAPVDIWSRFHFSCPNGQSVRNRYKVVRDLIGKSNATSIISIAAGSAQAVIDGASILHDQVVSDSLQKVVLVDESTDALSIARKRAKQFGIFEYVEFVEDSVEALLKRTTTERYDIVEACGILDYMPDRIVIAMIKKMIQMLDTNGQIIVSNMDETGGADWLRRVYNWEIVYRTPGKMQTLFDKAGVKRCEVYIEPWRMHPVFVLTV